MADSNPVYWAARETKECVAEAHRRVTQWFEWVMRSGQLDYWRLALRTYYAGTETQGKTQIAGEQGEFTTIKVNHLHSVGEHIVTSIAGQPPTFAPQALNNDHESTAQTVIASGILENAVSHKGLEDVAIDTTRQAWVLKEGFGSTTWDTTIGEDYAADPETGAVIKSGDVCYRSHNPLDVIRDHTRDAWEDHDWVILRRPENRYDLAADHPEFAEQILGLPAKTSDERTMPRLAAPKLLDTNDESDEVWVYEFYHRKTPATQRRGRQLVFCSPDVFWGDEPLKYDDIPVFRMAPEEQIGTDRGYSSSADLLAPQQAVNASYSTVLSNHAALGTPAIWTGTGPVNVEELTGFKLLKSAQKPEAVTLAATPAEIPAFGKDLIAQIEILSGVNAVRRGNLDATGKLSGAAYALIDAKFLESTVGLQKSYRLWMTKMATGTVACYRKFAVAQHTVRVVGKSNKGYVETFTRDDLSRVDRVDIEMGNPLQRTTSGRLQILETLMQMTDAQKMPIVRTPEQVFQVLTTGRLEPAIEGAAKELDNVKAENEALGDGKPAVALIIDNHPLHIEEHSGVLASPEARENPQIVTATLAHIQQHMDLWFNADPRALAARRIPPPPAAAPMMPPGGPGANGTPPPVPGEMTSTEGAPPPPGAAPQPNMPQMPVNPGTGEQAPAPMPA